MSNMIQRDQSLIWHPFEHRNNLPIPIKRGIGSYVYDEENKPYLDLVSSWWVNLHGHAHPEIAHAIYEQANQLEHILFSGFTHEPAVALAEQLHALLPASLKRFFYSDNGSTAVEVALKMAVQYWSNQGQNRTLFLSFEGGYHGDTFGAMAVGAESGYHDPFKSLLFKVLPIPFPATWDNDADVLQKEEEALSILRQHLSRHHEIAALILEPLVQGAAGMRICRPQFINQVVEIVREHGILVIFDEVMTGFGRTGTLFALDQLTVVPDFLCLSKGLSAGFLPLALTVTRDEIYHVFINQTAKYAFSHGHTYTANPLACAAALASLRLLVCEETFNAWRSLHQTHQEGLQYLANQSRRVKHIRSLGTIAAFEVETTQPARLNIFLKSTFLKHGLLIRPLGNTVYILPPYCTTAEMLKQTYQTIADILNSHEEDLLNLENAECFENAEL